MALVITRYSVLIVPLGNEFIFSKLNIVYQKLTQLSGTGGRKQEVGNVFRSLFKELHRANEGSIAGVFQAVLIERQIFKCDAMLIGLRFSWWEREWYKDREIELAP